MPLNPDRNDKKSKPHRIYCRDFTISTGKEIFARDAADKENRIAPIVEWMKSNRGKPKHYTTTQLTDGSWLVTSGRRQIHGLETLADIQAAVAELSKPIELKETREFAEQANGTIKRKSKSEIAAWDKKEAENRERQRDLENRAFLAEAISEGVQAALQRQAITENEQQQQDELDRRDQLAKKFAIQDQFIASKKAAMIAVNLNPLATHEEKLAAQREWVQSYAYDPDDVNADIDENGAKSGEL